MGTDIHFYVQKRDPETLAWEFVEAPESILSEWDKKWEEKNKGERWYRRRWYHHRNYSLFAMFADVRNGYGFAGVDTGDGFIPIARPRGLPKDFVPNAYILEHDNPDDCHSLQWLSLREVLDYPVKELETKRRGWVEESDFKNWLKKGGTGVPDSWCGGISGPNIRHVDIPTMTAIVQGRLPREGEDVRYYCQLEWSTTYLSAADYFFGAILPAVLELVGEDNVDNTRFVMWFDS